jgi:dihydroorotase
LKTLIRGGRIIDPASGTDALLEILIDGSRIAAIAPRIDAPEASIIDASRLVVAPGFIDMHVHLREPGQEYKETIATGTRAAAAGGFTSVCAMPNTSPPNDRRGATEEILARAAATAAVNVFPIGALTLGLRGLEPADYRAQLEAGVVAFSDDGRCIQDARIMRRAVEEIRALGSLITDHCEDAALAAGGVVHAGEAARRLNLRGIPAEAEEAMVRRDIDLAESLDARLHIAHLSTRGAVRLVREAKGRGAKITAEATPHHLVLDDSALTSPDTRFKVNPPLRSGEDVRALVEAVRDGTIDAVATDHAPHSPAEKAEPFDRAPFGMVGLETAVAVLLDRLVHRGVISLSRLVEMLSAGPARILGLTDKGRIAPGADADLTLFDPESEFTVDAAAFQSKGRNTPFEGWRLKGRPAMTIVGGRVAFPFIP